MNLDPESVAPRRVLALFLSANALLLAAGFAVWAFTPLHPLASPLLILVSLSLLFAGTFRERYRFPGWVVLAMYWAMQPMHLFYRDVADYVNASFAALAVPFFLYLAYRELVERDGVLRFAAGMAVVAGGGYFTLYYFPVLGDGLRYVVAVLSLNILDVATGSEPVRMYFRGAPGQESYMPILEYGRARIGIILACTGAQSILIFASGIIVTVAPRKQRVKALLATAPPIFGLNLLRVSGEIWGMNYLMLRGWREMEAYNFLENGVAKVASLMALFVLAYVVFRLLPSLHDDVMDLVTLHKKDGPLERILGFR